MRNAYIFVGRNEENISRRGWKNNMKMGINDIRE
jgi:hypothetical protein